MTTDSHKGLEQVMPGAWPDCTLAARNIRKELKTAFPGFKFSVKTRRYSMGDSIDITWTDGPSREEVERITGKYQEGEFNGMIDLYEDHNAPFNQLYGGTKYVFCNRGISDKVLQVVINSIWERYGLDGPVITPKDFQKGNAWEIKISDDLNVQDLIHRAISELPSLL